MTEIPESLYSDDLLEASRTYITTYTVNDGKPDEHEYDALVIDLPDLLDAIAATGLPVACPECKALSSLSVPLKDCKAWEVSSAHRPGCSHLGGPTPAVGPLYRNGLRVLDTRAGAEPHGES